MDIETEERKGGMTIYLCVESGCPGKTNNEGGYCWNCNEAAERHFGKQDSPNEFPDSKQKREVVNMGKRAICLHCKREMNITGRGLCFTCYQDLKVREKFPKKKSGYAKKEKAPAAVEEVLVVTEKNNAIAALVEKGHSEGLVTGIIAPLSDLLTSDELFEVFLKKIAPPEPKSEEPAPVDDDLVEVDPATEYFDAVQEEPIDADFKEVVEIEIKTDRDARLLEKIIKLAENTRRTPGDWMLCAVEEYLAGAGAD